MRQKSNLQLLIFKINNNFFAINSEQIKEIVENTESFPIPIDTPHFEKIFIHRNEIIGVLNTEYYFGIKALKSNFYLIFKELIAIPADELGGIFNLEQFDRKGKTIKSAFLKEIFYINDRPISVIDYEELKNHEGKTILFTI